MYVVHTCKIQNKIYIKTFCVYTCSTCTTHLRNSCFNSIQSSLFLCRWREHPVFRLGPNLVKWVPTLQPNRSYLIPRGHQVTRATTTKHRYKRVVFFYSVVCLIIIVVDFLHMCECSVGVDVGDGTTVDNSILSNVVMGCIVLGR